MEEDEQIWGEGEYGFNFEPIEIVSLSSDHHLRGNCTYDCEIHEKGPDERCRFGNFLRFEKL